jgi:hypothetical protein
MNRHSRYKPTFFDRHGPAGGVRLKAYGYGLIVFGLATPMFALVAAKVGLGVVGFIAVTLVGSLTLAVAAVAVGLRSGQAAADVAQYVTAGGSSTPYLDQFSQEQALVMKRDYAAALQSYEERIRATPAEPRVRIAAADLYATHGQNPQRAAELYREVQRIAAVSSGHDVYATNKLADLYLGPLGQPGRSLVEFRRLIDRYPGTAAALHAKSAIDNLKPDLLRRQSSS